MNYNEFIIQSVYEFEKYKTLNLNKISRIKKVISVIKNRFFFIYSLTRLGKYYKPSEKKYKLDKQLLFNAHKLIDPKLYHLSKSCLLTAEITKSITRANLRYGFECIELSAALLKEIYRDQQYPFKIRSFKWVNPMHPVIHLPKDTEERGDLHVDLAVDGGGESVTVWIPFTEYKYPGIVTVGKIYSILVQFLEQVPNLGYKLSVLIFKRVKKIPLIKTSKPCEWLSWNDTFRHSGNINQTNEMAIAFMVRFSNTYHVNNFLPIDKLLKIKKSDNDKILIDENKFFLSEARNIVLEFITQIKSKKIESPQDFLENINNSYIIKNTLKKLNSKKNEIFLLHITRYILETTFIKVSNFEYIELKHKNNSLLKELFKISISYLDIKIAKYFY